MKLLLNNPNNSRYKMRMPNNNTEFVRVNSLKNANQTNFTGKLFNSKTISNIVDNFKPFSHTFTNDKFREAVSKIDNVLGDNYFSKITSQIDTSKAEITIKDTTFFEDLVNTVKYPICDIWLDAANTVLKKFGKAPKEGGILANRLLQKTTQTNNRIITDIISQYVGHEDKFLDVATSNLAKVHKKYLSRDERVLNRMATATVSAIFSANDYRNISLIQHDDKIEANKSAKHRFKQEISRMLLSASITFITMGALDKYIKNSVALSSLSIGLGAAISEIGSRLMHHVPLRPLSPQQAKKYAIEKENKANKHNKTQAAPIELNSTKSVSFNSKVFKDFADNNGSFVSIDLLNNNKSIETFEDESKKTKKGKIGIKGMALLSFGVASALYLLTKNEKIKKIIHCDEIKKGYERVVDWIQYKKVTIGKDELITFKHRLEDLIQNSDAEPIKPLLNKFSDLLKNKDNLRIIKKRVPWYGIYDGLTKIPKTIFGVLSMPGKAIQAIFKLGVENQEKQAASSNEVYNKALGSLYQIYQETNRAAKRGKINNTSEAIIKAIKERTRDFNQTPDTGKLANTSRTLVTAISSYFFVNDYRNKVLIESKGRDVDSADAVAKERVGHKLANFVINGTLMNLFNSIFARQLNNSLWQATLIATATETCNESLIRKSICQPILPKNSRESLIAFEEEQLNKKGIMGTWSRMFMKLTGKKPLSHKAAEKSKK